MKIFVIGDHYSETGPAFATKQMISALDDALYQEQTNKLLRVPEIYSKIKASDMILISGHSKQNILAIKNAKKNRKPVVFWMHGCVEHENAINGVPNEDMNITERAVMAGSDMILAVSESFAEWLKGKFPAYADKIEVLPNGVEPIKQGAVTPQGDNTPRERTIVSVGGGMIRKRLLKVCEAVEQLNREGMALSYHIFGDRGGDSGAINAKACVTDHGLVEPGVLRGYMEKSALFVQNSSFETFGLAPLEGLLCGCSLICSKETGALGVFEPGVIQDADLIQDHENVDEIAAKIKEVLANPNHDRLREGLDLKKHTWNMRARRLKELCQHAFF